MNSKASMSAGQQHPCIVLHVPKSQLIYLTPSSQGANGGSVSAWLRKLISLRPLRRKLFGPGWPFWTFTGGLRTTIF